MNKAQARERFTAIENKYRDELRRREGYIQQLEQQLREALAGKVPDEIIATAGTIYMEAIISNRTKEGMVNLRWGFMSAQLTVEETRAHAIELLKTAEAAQSDSFLHWLLTEKFKANPAGVAGVIEDFRAYRERKQV